MELWIPLSKPHDWGIRTKARIASNPPFALPKVGPMVEAVLSDIDGTLVESNWLHAAAWRDAFAVIDIPLDIETLRKQIGKGGDQLIPVFVPWWKRPMV